MSIVSRAMRVRRSSGRYCRVRMLCRRSASFTKIKRTCSTMAHRGFREFLAVHPLLTRFNGGNMICVSGTPGPRSRSTACGDRLMKTSRPIVALALIAVLGTGVGCSKVRSKAAFKDGNKDYKEENFKKAVDDYQRAVDLDPNFSEAWFYLGSSHQAQYRPGKDTPENKKQLDDAIEAFKKSLETNPGQTESQKNVRRNSLAALIGIYADDPYKNYEEAQKYAQQLVADNPNDSKNLYALANLYEKFNKFAEAET